ncbi:MAG: hypothetical protein JWM68_5884 [Verrucomicrobiales bacterium]|nr:hypothetical protein [Verrucomicrobiales bacterium]
MKNKLLFVVLGTVVLAVCHPGAFAQSSINFLKQVKPILELNCVACHNAKHAFENGELSLATKAEALKGGEKGDDLVPGDAGKSLIYKYTILEADHKKLMPPKDKGGPLRKEETEILRQWIDQGADWPETVTLATVKKIDFVRDIQPILEKGGPLSEQSIADLQLWLDQGAVWPKEAKFGVGQDKELMIATRIREKIIEASKEHSEAEMKKYKETIPGTPATFPPVTFNLMPIRSGEFLMGSPNSEANRKADEGPQHKVKLDPFWMGECEVTWDQYELFMYGDDRKADEKDTYTSNSADAVTRPTKAYVEMSFGMGKRGYPAISMTQHAANKFCQWLSARTGHFYRLPTEAEWEYACRAGTTTAYSFGKDPSKLDTFAWYFGNSTLKMTNTTGTISTGNPKYQKVGTKAPNAWGLHDMHGNVAEWCLDGYDANFYKQFENSVAENPWNKATKPYPHVVRGGAWDEDHGKPADLRSAARFFSTPDWKQQDPQLPKSIWFLTDAQFLGFRVVRPLKVPSPEEMKNYWNSGVENE